MKKLSEYLLESFNFKSSKTTKKGLLVAKNYYSDGTGLYQKTYDKLKDSNPHTDDALEQSAQVLSLIWDMIEHPNNISGSPEYSESSLMQKINVIYYVFKKTKCDEGLEAYEYIADVLENEVYHNKKFDIVKFKNLKKVINNLNIITDYICIIHDEKIKIG